MSEVVIRCPNCGTTQGTVGECEACHEADTRYFCTNHEPGRWLDGPRCPACGAQFGVARTDDRPPSRGAGRAASRTPPSVRTTPPGTPPRARPPRAPREPVRPRDEPERESEEVWSGPVFTPGRSGERGRFGPSERSPLELPFPPGALKVVSVFGCLRRLVMLAILLFILGVVAFFALFGVGGVFFGAAPPASGGKVLVALVQPAGGAAKHGDTEATFVCQCSSRTG